MTEKVLMAITRPYGNLALYNVKDSEKRVVCSLLGIICAIEYIKENIRGYHRRSTPYCTVVICFFNGMILTDLIEFKCPVLKRWYKNLIP